MVLRLQGGDRKRSLSAGDGKAVLRRNDGPRCFFTFPIADLGAMDLHTLAAEAPGTIISTKDSLTIACGRGALTISSLQPENHKRMAAGDFVNGYQVKVNDTFDC